MGAKKHFPAVVLQSFSAQLEKGSKWRRTGAEHGSAGPHGPTRLKPSSAPISLQAGRGEAGRKVGCCQYFWAMFSTNKKDISEETKHFRFALPKYFFLSFNLFIQSKIKALCNRNTKHTVVTWKLNFQKFWLGH